MNKYRFDSEQGGRCLIYDRGDNTHAVATCYNTQMAQFIVDAMNKAASDGAPKRRLGGFEVQINNNIPPDVIVVVHPDGRREGIKVQL